MHESNIHFRMEIYRIEKNRMRVCVSKNVSEKEIEIGFEKQKQQQKNRKKE